MTSNKYLPTFLLLFTGAARGWGQSTEATAKTGLSAWALTDILTGIVFIAVAVLFVASLIIMLKTNAFLMKHLLRFEAAKHGVILPEETAGPATEPEEDFFSRLRKKYWENAVPQEREGEITLHHDYDGIRELDNHLPPWWVNLFILCVIWSVGYMWYYHWGGNGPNQDEYYKMEVAAAKKEIAAALAGKADAVNEGNVTALTDAAAIGEGEMIFKNVCAACHGQLGEGLVGPNFTDEYWLHGGGIKNVFKVIKHGVPEKGMIAWESQLKPADIQKVASYILTLKGTNPPNQKAPQGDIWKDDVVAQDSTGADKS